MKFFNELKEGDIVYYGDSSSCTITEVTVSRVATTDNSLYINFKPDDDGKYYGWREINIEEPYTTVYNGYHCVLTTEYDEAVDYVNRDAEKEYKFTEKLQSEYRNRISEFRKANKDILVQIENERLTF